MFALGKPFQPSVIMFVGKARSLPYSGAPERFFTWFGAFPVNAILSCEGLPGTNSLAYLKKFVTYDCKKLYNIGSRAPCYKNNVRNKRECLSLSSLFNPVYCLQARLELALVKHHSGAPF